jgi:hypothetical protein
MASATTAQFSSKSASIAAWFSSNLSKPLSKDSKEINIWAKGTPMTLNTVLSVKSLCNLLIGVWLLGALTKHWQYPNFPLHFQINGIK